MVECGGLLATFRYLISPKTEILCFSGFNMEIQHIKNGPQMRVLAIICSFNCFLFI